MYFYPGVVPDVLLKILVLPEQRLADNVVEVDTPGRRELGMFRFRQPRQLQRLLVVLVVQVRFRLHRTYFAAGLPVDFGDEQVAPVDEGGVLAFFQAVGVGPID